ncbi:MULTISPECIES: beta-ketoacyl-ACP synthase II [Marinobacter]|jgi:3-oxoacyl-[acyl-carrier-protein] synthase II|uniref:3-oxoacyl-[acyl-carrier-protein] synthase 2 n=2 Tax=Marinobacter TaxID=2742 RepID=A0A137SD52_9GAMM|nr:MULTISPECIES: beta-ketoacyl-ACP synthase II [Marinobacter]WBU42831.1 beta-ketoacyl-ACP synthase II [Marinobacter alkaliphilus]KXO10344.1 3-oxoacyl-[acyl-carrier-protein] synthase, KASII [Marinobacter excellens LAMA 842]MAO12989.1 beta-ketoacyl-[acyl-carrier-protein] synthase II [Marinobacter sp.]MCD1628531.1 beta-ketoacyl-ACP synthase II [Marinobacter shengliensis]PSF11031.1 beta-ketoacyl-[acyl-carrier-protein] synthase II [Marinobacter shengliensis]
MSKRRVVVTGMGMLSPVGNDVQSSWAAIRAGRSGIGLIDRFDATDYGTRIGGAIKDLDIEPYLSSKEARKLDAFIHYGLIAAQQAVDDSGLEQFGDLDKERVGIAIGSGIGGLEYIEKNVIQMEKSGPRKVSPFFVPASVINMISGNAAIRFGYKGPNIAIVTACTTGTHNIGYAARTIAYGDADVMLAGGSEMATTRSGVAAFSSARALSTRNDEPEKASRPWDKGRDGFVLSDGAGVVVLEELEHARARGATIYGEVIGFGMSDDAHHITAPPASGEGAGRSMVNAIRDAGLQPEQVDYINAHGTSTQVGDVAEVAAVKSVFGAHAHKLAMSSTKSMTGHLLGAAGAVEAIFSILAVRDGVLPPTINLDEPDEGCDLDLVPHKSREADVRIALSNSFGFGGTNGTLIVSRYED